MTSAGSSFLRGASASALTDLSARVARTHALADAAAIGEQLAGVASVLRSEAALRRMLADGSVEGQAKAGLATAVFGASLREDSMSIVVDAVERRWTAPSDLALAVERLAAIAVVRSAGAEGRSISDELFAVRQLIMGNPGLRSALSDTSRSADDRAGLLTGLLTGKAQDATLWLCQRAVASEGNVDSLLDDYQKLAASVQDAVVAVVRSARPLSDADQERLVGALGRQYGTAVHLHVVVEPDLVGGLRVEIGDDVIDGTIAHRIDNARRRLAG